MNRLRASGRKRAEESSVEGSLERQDGHVVWRARRLVVHGRRDFLGSEVNIRAATLLTTFPHKCSFVRELIGIRSSLGSEDLVTSLGRSLQDTCLQNVCPVMLWKVTQGGPVDDGRSHFWSGRSSEQVWVAIANGDRGNLCVHVEQHISIQVRNVVAKAVLVVRHHVQGPRVEHRVQFCDRLFRLRAWDLCANDGSGRLVWEIRSLSRV